MNDLIDRKIAIQGVRELFSMGDSYCDETSIIGMLNGLESLNNQNHQVRKILHKRVAFLHQSLP